MENDLASRIISRLLSEYHNEGLDLTKWELDFCESMEAQLAQGKDPSLKQSEVIYRLKDKAGI